MLVAGIVAYLLEANGFPITPLILGVVLGGMLEENLVSSLIKSDGSVLAFFSRPIAATLGVVTFAIWLWPLAKRQFARRPVPA
jgi:TctA family transporter